MKFPGISVINSMPWRFKGLLLMAGLSCVLLSATIASAVSGEAAEQGDQAKRQSADKKSGEWFWEMPGRVSLYGLQFGPAVMKDNAWSFVGTGRTFNARQFSDRLTLMIRFSYTASRSDTPLKFIIKLPDSRQYEESVTLLNRKGQYTLHFTIHRPEDFLGSGSLYIYYGFSIVDVLDFTIVAGS